MKTNKERPILFSTPMMQAILEGRKTQTRRIVKPMAGKQSEWLTAEMITQSPKLTITKSHEGDGYGELGVQMEHPKGGPLGWVKFPYGSIGDVLWVRETWAFIETAGDEPDGYLVYKASNAFAGKWRPSIFMPRAACRIKLEITDIKIERLKSITEADAIAEGAFFTDYGRICFHNGSVSEVGDCPAPVLHHPLKNGWSLVKTTHPDQCLGSARSAFGNLWGKINGAESWEQNPFVWAITFKRIV